MGVLNVTPDSFSDGGAHLHPDDAVSRALVMVAEGASVIDVGGESTRPGAQPVPADVELARVLPVIERLAEVCGDSVALSVDTRNAEVARAAVGAGASLINDVSATLWPVAADLGVGWVAMHGGGDPRTMQNNPVYDDVVASVVDFLADTASQALAAGVPEVWVDPGIGFAKTVEHNLTLLAALGDIVALGYPVLVGTSRKSTLGALLAASDNVAEPPAVDDRLEASVATAVWAIEQGVTLVRAHDVLATVQACKVVTGSFPAS